MYLLLCLLQLRRRLRSGVAFCIKLCAHLLAFLDLRDRPWSRRSGCKQQSARRHTERLTKEWHEQRAVS